MPKVLPPVPESTYEAELDRPITAEELGTVLRGGAKKKSPGIDGLSLEFYIANWDTICADLVQLMNHMFIEKRISAKQKIGIVISLPINNNPRAVGDYRPITLLTTEYKLLARVLARRLSHVVTDQLQGTQYCGIPGNTIMDALANIRDLLAHSEITGRPLCILSLDFDNAFDRISHSYIFRVLRKYGVSTRFVERLQAMYDQAEASVQVNAH
jgi:hypothetical protein